MRIRGHSLALLLVLALGLPGRTAADAVPGSGSRFAGDTFADDGEVVRHLNSFAMIFGRCVWIPPSPKAALVALRLFFGIGIGGEPDVAAYEAEIAGQYVSAGRTRVEAEKEIAALNTCFGTYEVPRKSNSSRGSRS